MALSALLLALAGCGGNPPAPPVATAPPQPHGLYKVGSPYQINGVWYYPAENWSYDETGIASWYGQEFDGKLTANGEQFNLNALTAAHRTLPMPCVVQVTNLENGRSLLLRVNDRGPYARARIIDVSRHAAQLLGFEAQGIAKVHVKIMVPESIQVAGLARRNGDGDAPPVEAPQAAPVAAVAVEPLPALPGVRVAAAAPLRPVPQPPPRSPAPVLAAPPPLPDRVAVVPVHPTRIFVQAGAFTVPDNAWRLKERLKSMGTVELVAVKINGVNLFRVRVGPVASVAEADQLLDRIVGAGAAEARITID